MADQQLLGAQPVSQLPQQHLRLLTFNLGLLRLKVFGATAFASPPFVEERFPHICGKLAEQDADIVALQEIYEQEHVSELLEAVKEKYPFHARYNNQRCWQYHCGLMFLSKYPIQDSGIVKHADSSSMERWFGCKSALWVHIDTPLGKLCLINLHTTAGGGSNTESQDVDDVRKSELREAIEIGSIGHEKGCKTMIVGDFNCGPEASEGNYRYMMENNYEDAAFPWAQEIGCTWDSANPLNNLEVFKDSGPQRIDHFMVHRSAGLTAISAKKVFTEAGVGPVQDQEGEKHVPLSDHYGLLMTFRAS
eukprot:TRINITY_DN76504_c0_g1_i1.p1 TRINITY_DN76504_c0_g1~~TRINITY_DN76504_c0_g1_i1.p1  ORF type:complete len:306 (-),score=47.25 TRINITY_DN76504_c0_g1_i1:70-987(-)